MVKNMLRCNLVRFPLSRCYISVLVLLLVHTQPVGTTTIIPGISIDRFTNLLSTEVENEFDYANYGGSSSAKNRKARDYWEWMRDDAWSRYEEDPEELRPVLVCDTTPQSSGWQRREHVLSQLQEASKDLLWVDGYDLVTVANRVEETCFMVRVRASLWQNEDYWKNTKNNNDPNNNDPPYHNLQMEPLHYAMKLTQGSVDLVRNRQTFENPVLDVMLCPGVLSMWMNGFGRSRSEQQWEQSLREDWLSADDLATKSRDAFFWSRYENSRTEASAFWMETLEKLETLGDTCKKEFAAVNMEFDFAVNSDSRNNMNNNEDREGYRDSAVSLTLSFDRDHDIVDKTCAHSLLLVLALHPTVCAVSTRPTLVTFNREASWLIQQSSRSYDTPFYRGGLTGDGQVVAVSDTGLDVDHCSFWDDSRVGRNFVKNGRFDGRQRKVVSYEPAFGDEGDEEYGHGTHVCGTVAGRKSGDGLSEHDRGAADGVAYDARLAFLDLSRSHDDYGLLSATPRLDRVLATGRPQARTHCMAWGTEYHTGYGGMARQLDAFLYHNPDLLVLTAMGSSSSRVGDPATAKNTLTVGASNSHGPDQDARQRGPDYLAPFSGRGPTQDGRTKPDLVAPGSWILSAGARPDMKGECDTEPDQDEDDNEDSNNKRSQDNNNNDDNNNNNANEPPITLSQKQQHGLVYMEGTSMATAVATGTAALVAQYYTQGYWPLGEPDARNVLEPSAALLKATLLNGAVFLFGVDAKAGIQRLTPYGNDGQNFGRISLVDSLYLKGLDNKPTAVWDEEVLYDNEEKTFEIELDTDFCPSSFSGFSSSSTDDTLLSVTLTWIDPPAAMGCLDCLLNDLDLDLTLNKKDGRQTTVYYPNNLPGPDRVHTAERIQLYRRDLFEYNDRTTTSTVATATITVRATNLVTASQTYALVATGCFDVSRLQFSRAFHFGDDYLPLDFGPPGGALFSFRSVAITTGVLLVIMGFLCICYALFQKR